MSNTIPEPVTAHYSSWIRTWWMSVCAFAMLAFATLFYFGLVEGSVLITGIGVLGIIACFALFVMLGHRMKADRDIVSVSASGFHDVRIGQIIPWSEITALHTHAPGTQVSLFVEAKNPERFIQAGSRLRKGAAQIDRTLGFDGLRCDLSGLDEPSDVIVTAAQQFLDQSR
jgi:hypothetical protein